MHVYKAKKNPRKKITTENININYIHKHVKYAKLLILIIKKLMEVDLEEEKAQNFGVLGRKISQQL